MKDIFYRYAAYPISLAIPVASLVGPSMVQQAYFPQHKTIAVEHNNNEDFAPIIVSYAATQISAP